MRAAFAVLADAPALALLHARSFPSPWSADEFEVLLASPGVIGLLADEGLALLRVVLDEAELLTIGVNPAARGQGLGRALLGAAEEAAAIAGAQTLHLEVAADNAAAVGLYTAAGYAPVGLRRGYYLRADGPPVDAFLMRRTLNTPPA